MKRKICCLIIILSFFITSSACAKIEGYDKGKEIGRSAGNDTDPIFNQISKMTIDEKIGQMVMAGVEGYELNNNTKSMIERYHVGGLIILGENVKNSKQLLNLNNSLKAANSANKIPLFLGVDEEGGRVSRMPSEFKKFPTNRYIGEVNNTKLSYKIGSIIGEEIKEFGFNIDFAPVLDINSNPKNPVIGDRSFGSNSNVVSKLGISTMKGIQSQGVISAVKHFPGHGDTSVDSHVGLPVVNNSLKRLRSFELIPFKKAIESNADMVMVAHILLPEIDTKNPSSLSKIIITDILRNDMKFNGVVITDDMTMGAVLKNYDIGNAAVKSVEAGSDIILVCHGYDKEMAVINALKRAVSDKVLSEDRINESVYRILKLKNKYKLTDIQNKRVNVTKINLEIENVLKMLR